MRRPEHILQIRVLDYLTIHARRDLHWFAIANGELRHPNVGKRLKAEGVTPGVPDICIMLEEGRAAWLELKARGGSLSDAQLGFRARAARLGHRWACCRTLAHAVEVLEAWGVLRPVPIDGMGAP